jgi:hypothetical protein
MLRSSITLKARNIPQYQRLTPESLAQGPGARAATSVSPSAGTTTLTLRGTKACDYRDKRWKWAERSTSIPARIRRRSQAVGAVGSSHQRMYCASAGGRCVPLRSQ